MRNIFVGLAGAIALTTACTAVAQTAASWPPANKAVQIIVPGPGGAGTTSDTIARLIAHELSKRLKGNFVVENHAGVNGNIGAGIAAGSSNDGSKLLFSWAGTLAVSPSLYNNLPFNPQSSFDAIGLIAEVPNVLVVNNRMPVHNMIEFTNYVKQHPGIVNFGSTGNGSSMHLAGELYMSETSTNMVHVPYSAPSQATNNLKSGEIQSMFQLIPGIIGEIKAGKVRVLGVMAAERSSALPDVPTMAEQGYPNLISSTWFALLAPKGISADIVTRCNQALNEILQDPEVKHQLAKMGVIPLGGTPQDLDKRLTADLKKWQKVIRGANIHVKYE